MASVALPHEISGKLRSLNILRDLPAVADLIEVCFSSTLDSDGRSFLDDMRRSAQENRYLNWAPRLIDSISLPLSGYVWEEKGRIVGNVSLIPFFKSGRRIYLVANVATHPDYRRMGIARALTEAAMKRAREKRADAIWLHVRDDNPGAITLYQQLGFVERARRTQWTAAGGISGIAASIPGVQLRKRTNNDWETQYDWFQQAYPGELNWYFQQSFDIFQPGIMGGIYRMLSEDTVIQWTALHNGLVTGIAALQTSYTRNSHLWLATPPRPEPDALTELLTQMRRMENPSRNLLLDYPANRGSESIYAAGFRAHRTLLWMRAPGATL